MRIHVAYIVTNTISGKRYVGVTGKTVAGRWKWHLRDAFVTQVQTPLHRSIRKHGADAFVVEPIASSTDRAGILDAEQKLIIQRGTKSPKGYNATDGGEGFFGLDGESLRRRSATVREQWKDPEIRRARIAAMQSGVTSESIEKRAAKQRGRIVSEEERARLSAISRKNWQSASYRAYRKKIMAGRITSEEAKQKISAGNKGKVRTEEMRERYRISSSARPNQERWKLHMQNPEYAAAWTAGMRGKSHSEETKKKMRVSQLGKTRGPEEIAKQRATVAALPWQAVAGRVAKWRATITVTRERKAAEKFMKARVPEVLGALGFGC